MTETPFSSTDPADDDLLVSLYLDGEATPAERARVEADPRLTERVQAFEAMANELSSVTPPPGLGRIQIAAALDVFDQQQMPAVVAAPFVDGASGEPPTQNSAGVTSLTERRLRKQFKAIPTWMSAAAAVALVVGGLGFASTLTGGSDDAGDVAMEGASDLAASSTNRDADDTGAANAANAEQLDAAPATTAADSEVAEEESMAGEAMEDDAAESADASADEQADSPPADEDSSADAGLSPIPLDDLEATTAMEYFELLSDQPFQPIADSPCAGSPLVKGLFGVDSFLSVVFEGDLASLLVQDGVPSTAVIVGPTCEIELE